MDSYFDREIVDTSKIDTLADVPSETVPGATTTERPPATADRRFNPNSAPHCGNDDKVGRDEAAARAGEGGGDGAGSGDARRAEASGAQKRPGQRALLRLRKKCDVADGGHGGP